MEERSFKRKNTLAIISLLFGIIAISPWILGVVVNFIGGGMRGVGIDPSVILRIINSLIVILLMIITPLTAIGGIICGILGRDSERKKTVLFGVLLSILAFVLFGLIILVS